MKDAVALLSALSDETRLRLVKAMMRGEFCVCELADALEVNQSNLSRHLAVLRHAGLLADRKDGQWVYYTVSRSARPRLRRLLATLGEMESPRTQLDAERMRMRLEKRIGGKCSLGYGELPPSHKKKGR